MKKYKFAFGSVQRVQRIAEEQAAVSLAEAQRAADAASAQLQARLADIGAARPAPGPRSTTEFHAQREHLDRHRVAVTAARAAEINALELLGSARADWVDAARKVRALDRLDERKRAEWTLETTHAAQLVTDEIATIRYKTEQDRT
ncbi:MAG TPA: flagellar export protein FliJ [Microthrixaceae bacterium]|nr:flagellar export protein FliJ [Microthrixaceae bacterium]HQF92958.1 flagellar export protein FliJ [Microthrixaceae bacterium]